MRRLTSISWWYWAVTDVMLIAAVLGWREGFATAIAFNLVQALHFLAREQSLTSFPVQVRLSYLALLLAGQVEVLYFIYFVQIAGTTAMVSFDYCPLARLLSLMPWNRNQPLTADLLRRTVFSPPVRGNILQGLPAE
ncbi:MAG: hypothetical protein PVJ83_07910 [Gammaproteobacteria bacterium]|jgi:hypothetical protein